MLPAPVVIFETPAQGVGKEPDAGGLGQLRIIDLTRLGMGVGSSIVC
jgi:hypothetical protein